MSVDNFSRNSASANSSAASGSKQVCENSGTSLARYTTLKVGGDARAIIHPSTTDELVETIGHLAQKNEPWFVLGGGSNLLVSTQGFDGTVVRTTGLTTITSPEPNVLEAGAGARLPHLAKFAATQGLSGLEFAVGIPGTVGGAVVMNAGAHGSCFANVVESVTVFDTGSAKLITWSAADLNFTYRRSRIDPHTQVVVSARLRLQSELAENIIKHTQENEDYRWRTQPLGWPNAGSTFKNPTPEKSAGYLLDQSGAKTLKENQAAVSAIHANFVINLGGATSGDITTLLSRMQYVVGEKFNLHLEPEWKTLGSFNDKQRAIWSGHH